MNTKVKRVKSKQIGGKTYSVLLGGLISLSSLNIIMFGNKNGKRSP